MYTTPEASSQVDINLVDRWIVRACEALCSTWDSQHGNFWRDSLRESTDAADHDKKFGASLGRGKGATSNNRAFQAAVAAAYFFGKNPEISDGSGLDVTIKSIIKEMMAKYFSLPTRDLRAHGENQENPYTDAQLALSLCFALSRSTAIICDDDLSEPNQIKLQKSLRTIIREVRLSLRDDGVKVHESALPHQFLTLYAVRAIDAAGRIFPNDRVSNSAASDATSSALVANIRNELVQQLGLHAVPAPGFDAGLLVSCCALFARFAGDTESPYIIQGVQALVSEQSERGSWPSAGVLSFGRRRLVYIPSVELALVLANLVRMDLESGSLALTELALPALDKSFRLIQSSYAKHGTAAGWRNDRTRSGFEVESWTTAVVVQFLLAYREILTMGRQEAILRKYRALRPSAQFFEFWPDLERALPSSEVTRRLVRGNVDTAAARKFLTIVDPTEDNSIVQGISDEIIVPTLLSVYERPTDTASFLLFGPPGTRKTSLVAKLADALEWPLVNLSPPEFLKSGIEGFEATADEIFEDLMHLQRVVILFDECEEFFRTRAASLSTETRTLGAFITAGMLPRLQRLRDNRRCVFVINSNVEAFELDDAVTRRGRLDRSARVGFPVLAAQLRYLDSWRSGASEKKLSRKQLTWFKRVLTSVEQEVAPARQQISARILQIQKSHPTRGKTYHREMVAFEDDSAMRLKKTVTFTMLDSLAYRCLSEGSFGPIDSEEQLRQNLAQEFERFGPDSFNPSRDVASPVGGSDSSR